MNLERGDFVASYEPLVHDVSVSIKHFEDAPLPNDGAVCTVRRQFLEAPHRIPSYVDIRSSHRNGFFIGVSLFALGAYMYLVSLSLCVSVCVILHIRTTVRYQDVMRLVPHATIKRRPRCHTFRVFASDCLLVYVQTHV